MQFGDHVVHDQLDLDVMRGETIGVIGPSGCGKSVLLSQIVGLITPTKGEIRVFGEDLSEMPADERRAFEQRWSVMFQDGALFSNLTVREMLSYTAELKRPMGESNADKRRVVEDTSVSSGSACAPTPSSATSSTGASRGAKPSGRT